MSETRKTPRSPDAPLPGLERPSKRRKIMALKPRKLTTTSNGGHFDEISLEVLYLILDKLSLKDIGQLALTSEVIRVKIHEWMFTNYCYLRAAKPFEKVFDIGFQLKTTTMSRAQLLSTFQNDKSVVLKQYLTEVPKLDNLAILCKRLTCLNSTNFRVKYSFNHFANCLAIKKENLQCQLKRKNIDIPDQWIDAILLLQFMRMLQTLSRGWDEAEFEKILGFIDQRFKITPKMFIIARAPDLDAVALETEMGLRLPLRSLVWELMGDDYGTRASWILAILNFWGKDEPRLQALILLSMFGPICEDTDDHYGGEDLTMILSFDQMHILEELNNHTDWELVTEIAPEDFHEGKKMFFTLAQAICSCMSYSNFWKEEMSSIVLDIMFRTPTLWMRENIAGFLLFCSESAILHYVGSMIETEEDDRINKAAILVTDMVIMSHRFQNEFSSDKGIGKVMEKLLLIGNREIRLKFQSKLWDAVQDHFLNADEDEVSEGLEVLTEFGSYLVEKTIFMKKNPDQHFTDELENQKEESEEPMEIEE